jgi:hypothetical protein
MLRIRNWRVLLSAAICLFLNGCRMVATSRSDGLVSRVIETRVIGAPADSLGAFEPHIAVDPADPMHAVVVAAGYRYRADPAAWCATTRAWSTRTGGRKWTPSHDLGHAGYGPEYFPERSDFTLDPVVSAAPSGGWYAVVLGSRTAGDQRSSDLVLLRADSLDEFAFEAGIHQSVRPVRLGSASTACGLPVAVTRSGRAARHALFVGSDTGVADKPWLAVDATRGAVHVAWSVAVDSTGERFALYAATKTGGDSVFRDPVMVGPPYRGLVHGVQVSVRSAAIDLVWAENASGRRVVRHAKSANGGLSFSDPQDAIVRPPTSGQIRNVSLTTDAEQPALCWTERRTRRPDGTQRVHENLWCSDFGAEGWTPASPVDSDSLAFEKLTLGALATNASGLWLLAYRSTADSTHVDLLHRRRGTPWRRYARLASRALRAVDYELGGRIAIGDYVGLAAARDRVYAAFVLPESSASPRGALYVSVVSTPTP